MQIAALSGLLPISMEFNSTQDTQNATYTE